MVEPSPSDHLLESRALALGLRVALASRLGAILGHGSDSKEETFNNANYVLELDFGIV
jgi:hypothetical protein